MEGRAIVVPVQAPQRAELMDGRVIPRRRPPWHELVSESVF
jgi:hypothetical protein